MLFSQTNLLHSDKFCPHQTRFVSVAVNKKNGLFSASLPQPMFNYSSYPFLAEVIQDNNIILAITNVSKRDKTFKPVTPLGSFEKAEAISSSQVNATQQIHNYLPQNDQLNRQGIQV